MSQDEGKRMPTLLPKEFSTKAFFAQKVSPTKNRIISVFLNRFCFLDMEEISGTLEAVLGQRPMLRTTEFCK